jgi:hypothetical protein
MTTSEYDVEAPVARDIDDVLVPLVLHALGCTDASLSRTPRTSQEPDPIDRSPRASSAEANVTTTWRTDSATCSVRVERAYSYFPGDVNEPMRASEWVTVHGARQGGATVTVRAGVGERALRIEVDGTPEERDRIVAAVQGAFAPRSW